MTSDLPNLSSANVPAASAFADPQDFRLDAYCYADRLETIPAIASALAIAGGWVTDRRTVSATQMDFRVELQLTNILDFYAAIVETGLELTRLTHTLLTELCTCRFHPESSTEPSQTISVKLSVTFLADVTLHSILMTGASHA